MSGYRKFWEKRDQPVGKLQAIGRKRKGLDPRAIKIAAKRIYEQRDFFPSISLAFRVYLLAARINIYVIDWHKRPWWKRLWHTVVFPRTLIWEYEKWRM